MARKRNNIEIEGTKEFYALPGRNKRNNISETITFDAPKEKRKPEPKKRTRFSKGMGLATINFSIAVILLALIVCLVVLVAIYYKVSGLFTHSLTLYYIQAKKTAKNMVYIEHKYGQNTIYCKPKCLIKNCKKCPRKKVDFF